MFGRGLINISVFLFFFGVSCYGMTLNSSVFVDPPPNTYDRTTDFIDRTLYIESTDYRGYWLRMQATNHEAYIFQTPEDYLFVDQYIRLQAMDCGDECICLRNRFSEFNDADINFWSLFSRPVGSDSVFVSNPAPQDNNDFKWKVYCTSPIPENTENCYICDFTNTIVTSDDICLYVKSNKYVAGNSLSVVQDHNWRILTYKAIDNGYAYGHFDLCNELEQQEVSMNYRYCVGIEVPLFSGLTVSPSLSLEIQEAVKMDVIRDGTTHVDDWGNEMYNYQTWKQENCTIMKVPIPPRTLVTVEQMTASYGSFFIKSQRINIKKTDLTDSSSCDSFL